MHPTYRTALIVGAGSGLSAALARRFAAGNLEIGLAARNTQKLDPIAREIGASLFTCDATDKTQVARLFEAMSDRIGEPDVVVYNASSRSRGPLIELVVDEVERALAVCAFGGFLVAQQAAQRMLANRHGAILFTGASASVKGHAGSAPFAMGKFALRGLAQSLARELSPQGIHVGHVVIDGAIRSDRYREAPGEPDSLLDPAAIAESYWQLLHQPRSAWTWELELRPWVERF